MRYIEKCAFEKLCKKRGIHTARRRISRLMVQAGLVCITRKSYKATNNSKHDKLIAKNTLEHRFNSQKPNQVDEGCIFSACDGFIFTLNGVYIPNSLLPLQVVNFWMMINIRF